jgi:proteasome accessory factor B
VVSLRGRWYVVGHDEDRDATRCFRLSRFAGPVRLVGEPDAYRPPEHVDLIDYVARAFATPEPTRTATVRLSPGCGAGIRRQAYEVDGDVARLRYSDVESLASRLVGYGAGVQVLEPPELRAAAIERLRPIAARPRTGVGS